MTDLYRCDLDPRTGRDRFTRANEDEIMAQDCVVAALETAAERIATLEEEGDRLGLMAAEAIARRFKAEDQVADLTRHAEAMARGLTQDCDQGADYGRNPWACNTCTITVCQASAYRRAHPLPPERP